MGKFMTVEGVTVKKTDLKRITRVSNKPRAYVTVAGLKEQVLIKATTNVSMTFRIEYIIKEAEER